jgi:hypothetical protein
MAVNRVKTLTAEGKSYNLFYKGSRLANITLEPGEKMTRERAFEIINDLCVQAGIKPRKHIGLVTYEEAEPETD